LVFGVPPSPSFPPSSGSAGPSGITSIHLCSFYVQDQFCLLSPNAAIVGTSRFSFPLLRRSLHLTRFFSSPIIPVFSPCQEVVLLAHRTLLAAPFCPHDESLAPNLLDTEPSAGIFSPHSIEKSLRVSLPSLSFIFPGLVKSILKQASTYWSPLFNS